MVLAVGLGSRAKAGLCCRVVLFCGLSEGGRGFPLRDKGGSDHNGTLRKWRATPLVLLIPRRRLVAGMVAGERSW